MNPHQEVPSCSEVGLKKAGGAASEVVESCLHLPLHEQERIIRDLRVVDVPVLATPAAHG